MQCPHCGAPIDPGVRFCPSCRKRVVPPSEGFGNTPPLGSAAPPPPPRNPGAPPPPPPSYAAAPASGYQPQVAAALFPPYTIDMRRPGVVTAMAVLNFVGGGFGLLGAVAVVFAGLAGGKGAGEDVALMIGLGAFYALIAGVYLVAGVGLLQMKSWARILQIVLACLGLLSCGFIISILMLVYLFKPGVKVLFSGKTAEELTPQEAADVAQLQTGSNGVVIGLIVALIAVPVIVAIIGIIAAIAIPSLLRARISANESGAIGNVRTVISAEAAYQSANAGYYDVPDCLLAPERSQCLGTNATGPFITPGTIVFDVPKTGYVMRFYPGEAVTAAGASPSSLTSFAVVAEPASPQTGVRTFCGDSTGIVSICTPAGGGTDATGGVCPQNCSALR
jgi:type IV pilus assembly protein PilA